MTALPVALVLAAKDDHMTLGDAAALLALAAILWVILR